MATQPASPSLPAAPRPRPFTRGSSSRTATTRRVAQNRSHRPPACGSPLSADLAGRAVRLSDDIPVLFDGPLAQHHKLMGRWALTREPSTRSFSRVEARRHIERAFNSAVHEILDAIDLAELRITVLQGEGGRAPAIAIVCESMGQLDLGWIETSEGPIGWRAAAYRALEQTIGRILPIFGYQDLFEEISMYYWEGESDDESALEHLVDLHGADPDNLEDLLLPSMLNERRPDWMIAANATPWTQLPRRLRRMIRALREAHDAFGAVSDEQDAWHFDSDTVYNYVPEFEECSSLPPLTLVPFDHFSRELDDIGRPGMEMGFMDVAGLCVLPDAARIDDWFATLRLGARLLLAAQDLIRFDPTNPRGRHDRS